MKTTYRLKNLLCRYALKKMKSVSKKLVSYEWNVQVHGRVGFH